MPYAVPQVICEPCGQSQQIIAQEYLTLSSRCFAYPYECICTHRHQASAGRSERRERWWRLFPFNCCSGACILFQGILKIVHRTEQWLVAWRFSFFAAFSKVSYMTTTFATVCTIVCCTQRWDGPKGEIENGVYLGHIASFSFLGPWAMTSVSHACLPPLGSEWLAVRPY